MVQISPSTPGVFRPWFSVTRRTARALLLNERVKIRCKAFTLPHFFAFVALTIRIWSRHTFWWAAFQSIESQSTSSRETAPASIPVCAGLFAVICFASFLGLPNFLVMKDQMEVGPLSRRALALICSITEQRLLSPSSYFRRSIGFPYSQLSRCRENDGVSTFYIHTRMT